MAAIAVAPSLDLVLLILLVLAVLQARLTSHRDFAARIRAPILAIALLAIGLALERVQGPATLDRFGAVGLVAGLVAAVGLLPYIHEFDPEETVVASPIPWIAFVGPLLAATLMSRAKQVLPADAGDAFGAMLLGLGLLNIVWGSVAAWRTENGAAAWRYSFMADWGLALCGFGLAIADGQGAALIVLFSIVLGRLPLYLWSRQALREKTPTDRPINLLVAAALAGSAPFAGFAARVLLLRGATQVYWPLALVLAVAMLLWLPASLRLGRSMGLPRGRQAVGVAIVLAVNVVLGLYPQPLLTLAGL
jgi:NADH:ubiquinone oxidoreductase subunit 2 (subunit N)